MQPMNGEICLPVIWIFFHMLKLCDYTEKMYDIHCVIHITWEVFIIWKCCLHVWNLYAEIFLLIKENTYL